VTFFRFLLGWTRTSWGRHESVTLFLAITLLLTGLAGNAEAQRKAKPKDTMKLSRR